MKDVLFGMARGLGVAAIMLPLAALLFAGCVVFVVRVVIPLVEWGLR